MPVAAVIEDLRRLTIDRARAATATDAVVIVFTSPTGNTLQETAAGEGLFEALRGVVGSLTLELASTGLRVNLVRSTGLDDATSALDFLATDHAAFVAGSTIDLTSEITS
jgi:hypothetical protein